MRISIFSQKFITVKKIIQCEKMLIFWQEINTSKTDNISLSIYIQQISYIYKVEKEKNLQNNI